MSDEAKIDVFKCLDFIRDNAQQYAQAKANRVYLEEFRKSKKSLLMKQAEANGHNAVSAQEREAYADVGYIQHLEGLKEAVANEEQLRWMMIAAQAKIEVWRTLESTRRIEAKTL